MYTRIRRIGILSIEPTIKGKSKCLDSSAEIIASLKTCWKDNAGIMAIIIQIYALSIPILSRMWNCGSASRIMVKHVRKETKIIADVRICLNRSKSPDAKAIPKLRFIPRETSRTSMVANIIVIAPIVDAMPIASEPTNLAVKNQKP